MLDRKLKFAEGEKNFDNFAEYAMTILTSTDEIVRNGGGRGREGGARRKGRNGRKRKTKGKDKSKPPTEPAESDKGRAPRHLSDLSDLRK